MATRNQGNYGSYRGNPYAGRGLGATQSPYVEPFVDYSVGMGKQMMSWNVIHQNNLNKIEEKVETRKADFLKAMGDWNKLPVEEPCDWTFTFPFVNDKFCDELLNEVENRGDWSPGNDTSTIDKRLNTVENVPTQDIHMKQIGFREQWNSIVKKYIAEAVSHLYAPFKTNGLNIAFVVKYEMGHQQKLNPHHDSSAYSINIALNTPGVDFEGGGTWFPRQQILANPKSGYCTLFPSVSHRHGGRPTTKGTRYIIVSFVKKEI